MPARFLPSNCEVDNRAVPHSGRVFLDDCEPVAQDDNPHLLGRVIGKTRILRHDLILIGIVNHDVAAWFQDLLDVPDVAIDQSPINMPETPKGKNVIDRLGGDPGKIRSIVLYRSDVLVAVERLAEFRQQLLVIINSIDHFEAQEITCPAATAATDVYRGMFRIDERDDKAIAYELQRGPDVRIAPLKTVDEATSGQLPVYRSRYANGQDLSESRPCQLVGM